MNIPFTKMHGAGNDYIYLDAFSDPALAALDLRGLARRMSDRHKGVGSDGLIVVMPPSDGVDAEVRMRMFNADGSESEMCGNGIRCVAKLAHDRGHSTARPMRVESGAGVLSIDYELDDRGFVSYATVDMGEPILAPARIPVLIRGAELEMVINHDPPDQLDLSVSGSDAWMEACGLARGMTCVSMGNPHVIFFCRDVAGVPLAEVGPSIEHSHVFPQRVNAHFVQVVSRGEVIMRTWERGSGITQACGTGACAVCVAGALTGRTDREILARLPGGALNLRWDAASDHVFMNGEAVEVFRGQWSESAAASVAPSRLGV